MTHTIWWNKIFHIKWDVLIDIDVPSFISSIKSSRWFLNSVSPPINIHLSINKEVTKMEQIHRRKCSQNHIHACSFSQALKLMLASHPLLWSVKYSQWKFQLRLCSSSSEFQILVTFRFHQDFGNLTLHSEGLLLYFSLIILFTHNILGFCQR